MRPRFLIGLIVIFLYPFKVMMSQGVAIAPGQTVPHSSALLDVQGNSKGVLIPRLTYQQRNAIPEPANGLLVFLTNDSSFYYHHGGVWFRIPNDQNASELWIDQNENILSRNSANQAITGSSNIIIGKNAFQDNGGGSNYVTAIGFEAARNDQTIGDTYLTAIGYKSAYSNSGNDVIALGYGSAYNNNKDNVIAIGNQAGAANTGFQLMALGGLAGANNSGGFLHALGATAGKNNSGLSVNAFGGGAAEFNTGNYVNAFGNLSGRNNTHNHVNVIGAFIDDAPQDEATILTGDLFLRDPYYTGTDTTGNKLQFQNGTTLMSPADSVLQIIDVLRLPPRNSAPPTPVKGMIYFDDALSKLLVWDGTAWQSCW